MTLYRGTGPLANRSKDERILMVAIWAAILVGSAALTELIYVAARALAG